MASIKSTRVVLPGETRPATIHFEDGVVVAIGEGSADQDFGDLIVLPGLVDSHVHVNEPGRTDWEGFGTATRAAVAGGTTTIVDMPLNSIPPTTTLEGLRAKQSSARGNLSSDVAFWGGIVPGSAGNVDPLVDAGVCGFKAFLTDSGVEEFPPVTAAELGAIALSVPLLVHAESTEALLPLSSPAGYDDYLRSRPPEAESSAIDVVARSIGGRRAHILHVSSAEGAEAIASAGSQLSGETCPHYLTFSAEEIGDMATEFKCAPPIRESRHREALWEALEGGKLSMVVSDHSPAPPELKSGDFATAWGGIASLQLRLPSVWSGAFERGIGVNRLAEWLARAPAALAGIDDRKGSIELGKDADFVVFDPEGVTEVVAESLLHRHPITPYDGMRLRGSVYASVLRGRTVWDGREVAAGHGRMLQRTR